MLFIDIFSTFLIILSFVISILAVRFKLGADTFMEIDVTEKKGGLKNSEIRMLQTSSFFILLSIGVISLVTGIGGFLFKCCKLRCYAVIYGFILGFFWFFIFVFGLVMFTLSSAAPDTI